MGHRSQVIWWLCLSSFFTASSLPEATVPGLAPGTGRDEKEEESLLGEEEGREVEECSTDVAHYSIYSLQKLQQLNEKLAHKQDALKALTASGQHNPKVLTHLGL